MGLIKVDSKRDNGLLPTVGRERYSMGVMLDAIGEHHLSLSEMLTHDRSCVCSDDMLYFDPVFFGKLPSYVTFCSMLKSCGRGLWKEFCTSEAELLRFVHYNEMSRIATKSDDEILGTDDKKFSWNEKLLKANERILDRAEKTRSNDIKNEELDLVSRLISSLSDDALQESKGLIDAEWEELQEGSK